MPLWPNWRAWHMYNEDTGQELEGQYEATGLTETPGAPEYAGHTALSRQDEILQYLHGNADRVTFRARLYAATALESINEEFNTLKAWAKEDPFLGRPPVIFFWVGADAIMVGQSVIESISDITYDRLTFFGNLRGAEMTITMRSYVPFEITPEYIAETRYHRAKQDDMFEMLAWREYGNAMLGELVRRRHPDKQAIQVGDVIKLPSVEALRKTQIRPHSPVFEDSFVSRETTTKSLREQAFDNRNVAYVSHIIVE